MNSLKMFDAAARHLNFRLAAGELNLTQGAVAQQVRKLESDLGVILFERKARGLELTEIGRSYHRPISQALTIIDDATQKLLPKGSEIIISIPPSFASKWLVPKLASFSEEHPNIDVQVVASESLANFHSDGVNLAIRQGKPPFGKELHAELLASLDLRAVCSPDFVQQIVRSNQLEDFVTYPLIQDSHKLWEILLEEAGLSSQSRILQFNQTSLAMDAAANGQGVALAPRILLNNELAQGRLVELWRDSRTDRGGYYIVFPSRGKFSRAVSAFLEWVLSESGDSYST
ncbi:MULTISPECIES: LysR substrate-binding domain-containing protein [Vibrio harveyi group]|uniref:LysR substrate-binding domain-containing protein n=1 Tax=Vibrio harveyi group TaxID=717610 RepID=UPI0010BD0A93|nr:LysR substrate-binding domain-containing protein [Vibrio alginolyticus]MCE9823132.1 LysR substrate-binding domain-containing protein [Vibrio alginolyticus]MCR9352149.1 LysR substrate-binding domain-containing protein [Vibrio alginolyticus]MCR9362584.1 LysR substrate-binding domain-containing protein [Vibrio alginolyticus]MCS0199345.1 LysR substrate-binding domain-containing protein [Vibrio alginolyticus]MCS0220893.1 LysR substrate-binding domain-containing protein [Vibrio alginolyticus]